MLRLFDVACISLPSPRALEDPWLAFPRTYIVLNKESSLSGDPTAKISLRFMPPAGGKVTPYKRLAILLLVSESRPISINKHIP